jgi:hypothetical protein
MTEIIAIGLNTFREAIRNKVLYLILLFAILLIGSSLFLSTLALDAGMRVIKNLGLTAINVFGLLVAMFIGVSLIPQEVESKTIYTIVSQGVKRWQFVAGKFLGLILTVYANIAVMAVLFLAIVAVQEKSLFNANIGWLAAAIVMQLFEMMIVVSVAILFSSFSTPILSAMMTLMIYVIGNMTNDFWDFIRLQWEKPGHEAFCYFLTFIWGLCPHLDMLDLKKLAIYFALLPSSQTDFPFVAAAFHAVSYSAVVLGIACLAFSKRDF